MTVGTLRLIRILASQNDVWKKAYQRPRTARANWLQ